MTKNSLNTAIFTIALMFLSMLGFAQKGNVRANPANVNLCQLYVATAFTPNGDNINDLFLVKYNEDCQMLEFNMKVFDRWGRLIFETNDPTEEAAWDGTSEGREMKEGVYIWRVYAKLVDPNLPDPQAEILDKQGTVALIR